jgi:hypothetical protein
MQIFRTQIFRVAAIMALTIIGFFVVVNVEPRMYLVIPAILIAAILIQAVDSRCSKKPPSQG